MAFAHAVCILSRAATREHGAWLRTFWLTPEHDDWVEVDNTRSERAHAAPSALARVFVTRGKLGELLAQEALAEYAERDALLALQSRVDALRAGEDETRWAPERRLAIAQAQRALEDAFYAAACPLGVTVVALSPPWRDVLAREYADLRLPEGRFVDATGRPARSERADKQLSM